MVGRMQLTTTVVTQTMEVRDTSLSGLMGNRPYKGRVGTNSQRRAVKRGNIMIRDSSTNIMNGCLHAGDSLLSNMAYQARGFRLSCNPGLDPASV